MNKEIIRTVATLNGEIVKLNKTVASLAEAIKSLKEVNIEEVVKEASSPKPSKDKVKDTQEQDKQNKTK
ncbi:hypothetical protein KAU11_10470 [Candidatus Babeliales bacterium]|nr:hypothetical protein [Candidatus Babeliales bacterium]